MSVIVDEAMVKTLDRNFLLDFFSLGAWAHHYTAMALYHEAQRIPHDASVSDDDKPRIQMVLRAKILGEVAASMETLGRFAFAVRNRGLSGIASLYTNMRENRANDFYRLCKEGTNAENLLNLPVRSFIETECDNHEISPFMEQIEEMFVTYSDIYLDDKEDYVTAKKLVKTYNGIKHGSHIVNNITTLPPFPVEVQMGMVPVSVRWPMFGEPINEETMVFVTRAMGQETVIEDIEYTTRVANALSNLCQLLILMLDKGILSYGEHDEYFEKMRRYTVTQ